MLREPTPRLQALRARKALRRVAVAVLAAVHVAGCESPAPKPTIIPATPVVPEKQPPPAPPAPPPPAAPVAPPKSPAELALEQGIALYDAGDFNGAIKQLLEARDIWEGPVPLRVLAHKTAAFSYCVTNRRPQCRQQFVEALKLDPHFALETAEKTHPIWNSEYEAAKRSLRQPADPKKSTTKPATKPAPKPPG